MSYCEIHPVSLTIQFAAISTWLGQRSPEGLWYLPELSGIVELFHLTF